MRRASLWMPLFACAALVGCSDAEPGSQSTADTQIVADDWEVAGLSDPNVLNAAKFASSRIGKGAAFKTLESAEQQEGEGTVYRLNIKLDDGSKWTATVRRKIDGSFAMIDSRQIAPLALARLALDPGGLRIFAQDGMAHFLPYGASREEVMKEIAFRGPAKESTNAECGAGPVQFASWPDGLDLLFQDDKFGGWSLHSGTGAVRTLDDIAVGSTLADLRKTGPVVVEETTLGHEFLANGVSGILDGTSASARITDLWAGLSCVFR